MEEERQGERRDGNGTEMRGSSREKQEAGRENEKEQEGGIKRGLEKLSCTKR